MVFILHFLLFLPDKGGILLTNFHQASIEIIATWSWDILVLSLSLSVWISSLKGKNSYLVTGVNLLTLGLSVVFRIWAINCCPIMRTSGIHFDPYLPSPLFSLLKSVTFDNNVDHKGRPNVTEGFSTLKRI